MLTQFPMDLGNDDKLFRLRFNFVRLTSFPTTAGRSEILLLERSKLRKLNN